uniref:Uncharacterized protein n=1 Tax=Oryza sativa subsp. japonica TaxID=39947 RepID=Q6ZKS6_ORYSJ|nr:hypothetical protein [Oryza sativa Japonica Group]
MAKFRNAQWLVGEIMLTRLPSSVGLVKPRPPLELLLLLLRWQVDDGDYTSRMDGLPPAARGWRADCSGDTRRTTGRHQRREEDQQTLDGTRVMLLWLRSSGVDSDAVAYSGGQVFARLRPPRRTGGRAKECLKGVDLPGRKKWMRALLLLRCRFIHRNSSLQATVALTLAVPRQ